MAIVPRPTAGSRVTSLSAHFYERLPFHSFERRRTRAALLTRDLARAREAFLAPYDAPVGQIVSDTAGYSTDGSFVIRCGVDRNGGWYETRLMPRGVGSERHRKTRTSASISIATRHPTTRLRNYKTVVDKFLFFCYVMYEC